MKLLPTLLPLLLCLPAAFAPAQTAPPAADPLAALGFLEGTWDAQARGSGAASVGTYSFSRELGNHILARHSTVPGTCKGPATFDCEHGDLLYIYADAPGAPLSAIYFDNEGHVIHYAVTTPTATEAIFLSSEPGPQFQLVYERKAATLSGKFQMRMPGQADWHSYLEWSGPKK